MLENKIKAFQNYLQTQKAEWLLLTSLGHEVNDAILTYLLTYEPENAALLIPQTGQPILFLTPFEVPEAMVRFPALQVKPLNKKITDLIKLEVGNNKFLIHDSVFPVVLANNLNNYQPALGLDTIVASKNPPEIEAMRTVISKTDELFKSLITEWPKFKTELDAARQVYQFALDNDCTISFPPIIASGPNAAEPHHQTDSSPLVPGFCVIDLGLKINGYCSDLSRTIYLGKPTESELKLYDLVLQSQKAAIDLVKPGVLASDLDKICREVLGEQEKYFIHGLGHGVGTAVHEWPSISSYSQARLEKNMIITIEPGLYFPGKLGLRIEDDVLVTEFGSETLNQASQELIVLPI